jgi:hypothetical protein
MLKNNAMDRCALWWMRASMFLCEAVPKVPEGCLGGFWHFWHPVGWRIRRNHALFSVLP